MPRKNQFAEKHFHDEEAARAWFEAARWPDGPVCPTCGSLKHYATKKPGRYRCGEKECRRDFTVMTGSVMERSHAKLTQWAAAFCLYAASKKGFTAIQLHRHLGCEYNTAWFLHHRVMEAMRRGGLEPPMGGPGQVVEVDEAYHGNVKEARVSKQRQGRPYKARTHIGQKRANMPLRKHDDSQGDGQDGKNAVNNKPFPPEAYAYDSDITDEGIQRVQTKAQARLQLDEWVVIDGVTKR